MLSVECFLRSRPHRLTCCVTKLVSLPFSMGSLKTAEMVIGVQRPVPCIVPDSYRQSRQCESSQSWSLSTDSKLLGVP